MASFDRQSRKILHSKGELQLPAFITPTIRGAVNHWTPDHATQPSCCGVYLEDLWDQKGPVEPLFNIGNLPLNCDLVIGSCRKPDSEVIRNLPNTNDSLAISTFQGSQRASTNQLLKFFKKFDFDVIFAPYDFPAQSLPLNEGTPQGTQTELLTTGSEQSLKIGHNRMRKMRERSKLWTNMLKEQHPNSLVLAEIPDELNCLEYLQNLNCDGYILPMDFNDSLLDCEKLRVLNKPLKFEDLVSPGFPSLIAKFDFVHFDPTSLSTQGLAICDNKLEDLNNQQFALNTSLLGSTSHTKAYIHHLLIAGEMTAQIILTEHNLTAAQKFFRM